MMIPSELLQTPYDDYFVDRDGNVWSTKRGLLKMSLANNQGYPFITVNNHGKRISMMVHVLVCTTFHGEKPSSKHEVRHLDGNRKNNTPNNLRWGTRSENIRDSIRHGTSKIHELGKIWGKINSYKRENRKYKLTISDAGKIREAFKSGAVSQKALSVEYAVDASLISRIISNKIWREANATS